MDIKFTTKAQDALGAAVRIAAAKGNAQVEPVHILDSLLQQGEGIASAPGRPARGRPPATRGGGPP